jgi:hypothetical protein
MASFLPAVAALIAGVLAAAVLLGSSLGVTVSAAKVCGKKIIPLLCSDLPSLLFAPPSSSCLQDPGSSDMIK